MDFKEYLARKELSASGLKNLSVSPAYFMHKKLNPDEETDAMRIGSAIHESILTPDLFNSNYVAAPACDKRTTAGKAVFAAFEESNKGKKVLSAKDFELVTNIKKSVLSSPKINQMLKNGQAEHTIFWEFEGVKFKCRIDFLSPKFILDLKSTKDAKPDSFAKDCINLNYHLQLALYQECVFQTTGNRLPVIIFAIEKDAPFDYCVFQMGQDWLDLGMRKAKKLISIYKECVEKNEWPGYSKDVQQLALPAWVKLDE